MTEPSEPTGHTDPAAVPTCPRHPERESRIRCQRCGRPVCPDCQRPAAVGVHCVDCVAQAEKERPVLRTMFGGVARPGRPVVTYSLIATCVVVWLLQMTSPQVTNAGAFAPAVGYAEPWRFVTAAFLHSPQQPMHIVFNMLCLWQLGQFLEPALGRARFLTAYLLTAIGGSVGYMWISSGVSAASSTWFVPTVGASGAVFGLFGMVLLIIRHLGGSAGGLVALLAINALLPFFVGGIAWQAHVGGFITGALIAAVLIATRTKRSQLLQWGALAGVGVLVVGLAVLKYALVIAGVGF